MATLKTRTRSEPIYAMGYTAEERQRLLEQAQLLEDSTRRLFLAAGITDGMTVLDLGCGVGDVSFLATSLVGERGRVVGVDRDPRALQLARDRAAAKGLANVEFIESDITNYQSETVFDALVGRLVLLYLADPADVVRGLTRMIRPGGVVAFQDYQFDYAGLTYPPIEQMELFWQWFIATFRRAGVSTSMGLQLYQTLIAAGLPAPHLQVEHPLVYAADPAWIRMPELALRSILPLMEQFGIATAAEVDIDTWTERLEKAVINGNAVGTGPMVFGAWATKP